MKIIHTLETIQTDNRTIFLAGPTHRTYVPNTMRWRMQALEYLEKYEYDGVVFVPEMRDGSALPQNAVDMYEWEHQALDNTDHIVFWIPRDLLVLSGFTTNIEFGLAMAYQWSRDVWYGRPDYSFKNDYLDWLYDKQMKGKPYNNLEQMIKELV
jgi:hypothetical protein